MRSVLKQSIRPGFPLRLHEGADRDGLPVFFDDIGPLARMWGGGQLSELQLSNMRLEKTEHVFPGGVFLRRLDDNLFDGRK